MIKNDIRFAFRILGYGLEVKKFFLISVILLLLGIVWCWIPHQGLLIYGIFMLMLAPSMLLQSFMGLNYLRLVQASPRAKAMQTRILAKLLVLFQVTGYLLAVLMMLVKKSLGMLGGEEMGFYCIILGVFSAATILFYVFSYRWFLLSTAAFYLIIFIPIIYLRSFLFEAIGSIRVSALTGAVLGLLLLLLMWFPVRGFLELSCKSPLDRKALGVAGKTLV